MFDFLNDAVSDVRSITFNNMTVYNELCRITKVIPMLEFAWIG
jgi:hypothetical protein